MRSTTDNTESFEHNWIQRLKMQVENIPTPDGVVVEDLPREATMGFVSDSVRSMANEVEADFDVEYQPSGYVHPVTGEHVVPVYQAGTYRGESSDQYILRGDTHAVVGNMSGRYPTRDGYKHVW